MNFNLGVQKVQFPKIALINDVVARQVNQQTCKFL
jgi:hypothetical protein